MINEVQQMVTPGHGDSFSWWHVFAPLFVSDALNAYLCIIVFIRQYLKVGI